MKKKIKKVLQKLVDWTVKRYHLKANDIIINPEVRVQYRDMPITRVRVEAKFNHHDLVASPVKPITYIRKSLAAKLADKLFDDDLVEIERVDDRYELHSRYVVELKVAKEK